VVFTQLGKGGKGEGKTSVQIRNIKGAMKFGLKQGSIFTSIMPPRPSLTEEEKGGDTSEPIR